MVERRDLATDPDVRAGLAGARLAQAYFSRRLNELNDEELYAPSLSPGFSRAHVVARVGYQARAIARLVEWAETGIEQPMHESDAARRAEIEFGATLSDRALRHLSDHAAVQLDVCWRDLPADRWTQPVRLLDDKVVAISETLWLRTRELWSSSLALDNGTREKDLPERVRARLASSADLTG